MAYRVPSGSSASRAPGDGRRRVGPTGLRRIAPIVVAICALLIGLGLIVYPYVSDYLHKRVQAEVSHAQVKVISHTDRAALSAELARARAYNKKLAAGRTAVTDPFDPMVTRVTSREYEGLLNLNDDGVMATIVIPKVGVSVPIYHGTGEAELQKGVGHMEQSSLPVGGAGTHAVLAGHNGLPSMKVFDDIGRLGVGDYFVIQVLGHDLAYRVIGTETVLPADTKSLSIQPGRDLVTLVTCTPYGINTHRLLVHAERCPVPAAWRDRDRRAAEAGPRLDAPLVPFTLAGFAVAAGLLGVRELRRRTRDASGGRGVRALGARQTTRGAHFK